MRMSFTANIGKLWSARRLRRERKQLLSTASNMYPNAFMPSYANWTCQPTTSTFPAISFDDPTLYGYGQPFPAPS
uniref:Uncharacterized protein n=1 Tax=Caenorhabditis japonica TaxID=281687 RepID=A0A8R1J1D5_CAEJA